MKISILDASTLGEDLSLAPFDEVGEVTVYDNTAPDQRKERVADAEILVLNKIRLDGDTLRFAKKIKLICVAATGYDNIDVEYCKEHGIGVCNVPGYSSYSVSQVTVSMVLSLSTKLFQYNEFVKSGRYSESGIANRLTPVYHEIHGLTWGIVGLGNIGKEVAKIAEALGCEVIVCKKNRAEEYNCTDIDTLCKRADIITIHTPLTKETEKLIDSRRISFMKNNVILVNSARGAVTDESAIANAVKEGRIGAFGCDVYTKEPFEESHPFYEIKDYPNVCLTPHMAWGAYEARCRCVSEIVENIKSFNKNLKRNRVDL